tara:strand:- start:377 stop:631 length:255 start_codon:yes stop_codon:yes gene_type:complete
MDGLKMTKIIILALMVTNSPLEDSDSYVFTEPHFDSVPECQMFVSMNIQPILKHLFKHFDGKRVQNIYCVPEKQLNQFIENTRV